MIAYISNDTPIIFKDQHFFISSRKKYLATLIGYKCDKGAFVCEKTPVLKTFMNNEFVK